VSADEHGRVFLNREEIDAGQLEGRLRPLLAESRHRVVTFRGDRRMPYERFVKAVDAARAAGAAHIDIAHEAGK